MFTPASVTWQARHWANTALPFTAFPVKLAIAVPSRVVTSDAATAAGFGAGTTCSVWLSEPSEQADTNAHKTSNPPIALAIIIVFLFEPSRKALFGNGACHLFAGDFAILDAYAF
jgi:hypothetical protein